jgi:hypothetical protein
LGRLSSKEKRAATVFIIVTIVALALAPISVVLTIIIIILGLAASGSILYARKETRVLRRAWATAGGHICGAVRAILGDLDELASLSTSFA